MHQKNQYKRHNLQCPDCKADLLETTTLYVNHGCGMENGNLFTPLGKVYLTPSIETILLCLLEIYPRVVTRDSLQSYYDFHRQSVKDGISSKLFNVLMCRLRREVKPLGLEVRTLWGRGWQLTIDFTIKP